MILKGSQRGGGRDLAVHLMKMDDNEHVRLHELRGFVGDHPGLGKWETSRRAGCHTPRGHRAPVRERSCTSRP